MNKKIQIEVGDVVVTQWNAWLVIAVNATAIECKQVERNGKYWNVKDTGYTSNIDRDTIKDALKNQTINYPVYG